MNHTKVLIIQVKQIGDLLLTLPVLDQIKKTNPYSEITLVIKAECVGVAPFIVNADHVMIHRSADALNNARSIRKSTFDAVLDFSGTDRSLFYSLITKAKKKATYVKYTKSWLRNKIYNLPIKGQIKDRHVIDYHMKLIKALDMEPVLGKGIEIELTPTQEAKAKSLLEKHEIKSDFCVIHPGTARKEKYWLTDRWSKIFEKLNTKAENIVITGGRDQAEQEHINKILLHLPDNDKKIINLAGKLSLEESALVISQSDLFLGVDTAAMHFASGFNKDIICLFGPTDPFQWGPRNQNAQIIKAGSQEITTPSELELGVTNSMENIEVSVVEKAIANFS